MNFIDGKKCFMFMMMRTKYLKKITVNQTENLKEF